MPHKGRSHRFGSANERQVACNVWAPELRRLHVWKRPDPSPLTSRLRCHYTESIKNGWGRLCTAHHSPGVKWVGHRGRVSQHIQMRHFLSPVSRVQCLGFISSHILWCWILKLSKLSTLCIIWNEENNTFTRSLSASKPLFSVLLADCL